MSVSTAFRVNSDMVNILIGRVRAYRDLDHCPEGSLPGIRDEILSSRHDLLHCLICECLGVKAALGTYPLSRHFPEETQSYPMNLSPDIVHILGKKVFLIDPTITTDPAGAYDAKMDKYNPVKGYLEEQGYSVEIIPVSVSANLNGLIDRWPKCAAIPSARLYNTYKGLHEEMQLILNGVLALIKGPSKHSDSAMFSTLPIQQSSYIRAMHHSEAGLENLDNVYLSQDQFEDEFVELSQDPDIRSHLMDKETDPKEYADAFTEVFYKDPFDQGDYKPSHHFPYAPSEPLCKAGYEDFPTDQRNTLLIIDYVSDLPTPYRDFFTTVKQYLKESFLHKGDLTMFKTGSYSGTIDQDVGIKSEKPKDYPTRKRFREQGFDLKLERPYIEKSRILTCAHVNDKFLDKSAVKYFKQGKQRIYRAPTSCPVEGFEFFEAFKKLCNEDSLPAAQVPDFLFSQPGPDAEICNRIKNSSTAEFKKYIKWLSKTPGFHYSYHTHLAAKSVLHFSNYNTNQNMLFFINTGLPNVLHIARGGGIKRNTDQGQPFFSVVVTKDPRWISPIFGKFSQYQGFDGQTVCIFSWRRLNLNKLALLRDAYFQTLSTGFDSFTRTVHRDQAARDHCYMFRMLASLCTSQKCAELLMDVRYMSMSLLSRYSDCAQLIRNKFCGPYPNAFSRWIVQTLSSKMGQLVVGYAEEDSFKKRFPVYDSGTRLLSSKGGDLEIPSIWTDHILSSLQDWFDELFVYCHTGKEPSSERYESIKSIKTIREFQLLYDSLNNDAKYGRFNDKSNLKNWLLTGKVGCWIQACYHVGRAFKPENQAILRDKIFREVYCEPLSQVVSTKACLPEYETVVRDKEDKETQTQRRKREAMSENVKEFVRNMKLEEMGEYRYKPRKLLGVPSVSAIVEEKGNCRAKVHDCMQDYLVHNPSHRTTMDAALWNINDNGMRADAHFCIKAQYGAKREFYVVNFGAKCMLRCQENVFKCLAQSIPTEMISNPGDSKLIHMSKIIDEATKWESSDKTVQFFVNGDCTKWSACETMSSFLAFSDGLEHIIGEDTLRYCKSVFSIWGNKRIKIPDSVLRGTRTITEVNSYLLGGEWLKSTQNFLQGMFNYSSSVKASLATEFVCRLWQRRFPERRIYVRHLEHSDDYVLVVRCYSIKDFEDFRIMHKLMQRLCGISDSVKKTNIQCHIMEFISLFSFNGHMAFPNIKKTKEVGLNISSEGLQRDLMNSISRTQESVRLGVPLMSAYIQQRIQNWNILDAYSLVPGMINYNRVFAKATNLHSLPIELGGVPDCLPIFYINATVDPNHYRLHRFSKNDLMKRLFYFSSLYIVEQDTKQFAPLISPAYVYQKYGNIIQKIRGKVKETFKTYNKYLDEHPEYIICKPNDPIQLKKWLETRYFCGSFSRAYQTASRANLVLRISHFVNKPCIVQPESEELVTLANYLKWINHSVKMAKMPQNYAVSDSEINGYNVVLDSWYQMLAGSALFPIKGRPNVAQANELPAPIRSLDISTPVSKLIHFSVNPNTFSLDHGGTQDIPRMLTEIKRLEKALNLTLEKLDRSNICRVNKLASTQRSSQRYCLNYMPFRGGNLTFLKTWLENGIGCGQLYEFKPPDSIHVEDPFKPDLIYERHFRTGSGTVETFLDSLTNAYYFLVVVHSYSLERFINIIKKTIVNNQQSLEFLADIDVNPLGLFASRQCIFFRGILLGDWRAARQKMKDTGGYVYSFLDPAASSWDIGFKPEKMVYLSFRGYKFNAALYQGRVIVISEAAAILNIAIAFLISSQLFGLLSMSKMERYLSNDPFEILRPAKLPRGHMTTGYIVQAGIRKFSYTPFEEEKTIPVLFPSRIYKPPEVSKGVLNLPLNVSLRGASLHVGKLKMFRLPLLSCSSENNIDFGDFKFSNMNFNRLLGSKIVYNYLRNKQDTGFNDAELLSEMDTYPFLGPNKILEDSIDCLNKKPRFKAYLDNKQVVSRPADEDAIAFVTGKSAGLEMTRLDDFFDTESDQGDGDNIDDFLTASAAEQADSTPVKPTSDLSNIPPEYRELYQDLLGLGCSQEEAFAEIEAEIKDKKESQHKGKDEIESDDMADFLNTVDDDEQGFSMGEPENPSELPQRYQELYFEMLSLGCPEELAFEEIMEGLRQSRQETKPADGDFITNADSVKTPSYKDVLLGESVDLSSLGITEANWNEAAECTQQEFASMVDSTTPCDAMAVCSALKFMDITPKRFSSDHKFEPSYLGTILTSVKVDWARHVLDLRPIGICEVCLSRKNCTTDLRNSDFSDICLGNPHLHCPGEAVLQAKFPEGLPVEDNKVLTLSRRDCVTYYNRFPKFWAGRTPTEANASRPVSVQIDIDVGQFGLQLREIPCMVDWYCLTRKTGHLTPHEMCLISLFKACRAAETRGYYTILVEEEVLNQPIVASLLSFLDTIDLTVPSWLPKSAQLMATKGVIYSEAEQILKENPEGRGIVESLLPAYRRLEKLSRSRLEYGKGFKFVGQSQVDGSVEIHMKIEDMRYQTMIPQSMSEHGNIAYADDIDCVDIVEGESVGSSSEEESEDDDMENKLLNILDITIAKNFTLAAGAASSLKDLPSFQEYMLHEFCSMSVYRFTNDEKAMSELTRFCCLCSELSRTGFLTGKEEEVVRIVSKFQQKQAYEIWDDKRVQVGDHLLGKFRNGRLSIFRSIQCGTEQAAAMHSTAESDGWYGMIDGFWTAMLPKLGTQKFIEQPCKLSKYLCVDNNFKETIKSIEGRLRDLIEDLPVQNLRTDFSRKRTYF